MSAPGLRLSLSDLPAAGQLVLDTYVTQLENLGVKVPGRRYVTPGFGATGAVWDGEQLNVAIASVNQGQPGAAQGGTQYPGAAVLFAQWAVILLRKIPILSGNTTGPLSIPSPEKINQAGLAGLSDVAAMTNAALQIHAAYIFNPAGTGMAIDSVQPMGPQGGIVGVRLLFTASLT